jgi:ABC-type transporter Mla maintaining outer membrane lipid asymmetry ATPase subunit MlaF
MSEEDIQAEVAAEAVPEVADHFDGEFPIVIQGLRNSFGDQVVHQGLDLKVRRGEVLADGKVIAVGTIPELLESDHPWIQEYFNGPRGRAAQSGAGLGKTVDSRGQTGA